MQQTKKGKDMKSMEEDEQVNIFILPVILQTSDKKKKSISYANLLS